MDELSLLSDEIQPDTTENDTQNTTEEEPTQNADPSYTQPPIPEEAQEDTPDAHESEDVSDAEDPNTEDSEPSKQNDQEEISALRADVARLQQELQAQRAAFDRMNRECAEFAQLYPDQSISSIPRQVWGSVGDGVPLAAAYALYCVKKERCEQLALQVNQHNRETSGGDVSGGSNRFLSPGEVRKMSAEQVRENYSKIIDSMKLWS